MEEKKNYKLSNKHEELKIPFKDIDNNDEFSNDDNTMNKFKKPILKKPGKTLLIKLFNNSVLNDSDIDNLEGLVNKSDQKTNGNIFLLFDNVNNSLAALKKIKNMSSNYKVKFSYYKVFFTINGLIETSDYNETKKLIIDHVSNVTNSNVLYCKLYCKDNKYLGCGDLTIDTLDGLNKLLSKESEFKDFKLNDLSGTFYKFNIKKK